MSRELALQVARARGAYLPIVMATIEAETNFRNVLGEYAAATARFGIGFGQVHLRWHFASLQQVARELGVALPSDVNPLGDDRANEPFRRLLLGNALLSMHFAVAVIQRTWLGSGANWDRFTEFYVGRGISARDRERRRVIWHRWLAYFGVPTPVPPVAPPVAPPVVPPVAADEPLIALGFFVLVIVLVAFTIKGVRRLTA